MTERIKPLEVLVKELSPSLQAEVRDFVEFLLTKRGHRPCDGSRKDRRNSATFLRQDWADALIAYRGQFTSVELQKKALEWRGD